jgi:hypothetical protein
LLSFEVTLQVNIAFKPPQYISRLNNQNEKAILQNTPLYVKRNFTWQNKPDSAQQESHPHLDY